MLTYLVIANPICAARGVNIALGGKHAMKSQPCRKFSFLLSTICQPCTTKELLAAWLPPDACCTTFQSQLRKEQQMVKLYLRRPFLITWNCAAIPFNGNQVSPMKDSQLAIAHLDRCHTGHWSKVLQTQLNVGSFSITNFTTFLIWIDLTSKLSFVPKREY